MEVEWGDICSHATDFGNINGIRLPPSHLFLTHQGVGEGKTGEKGEFEYRIELVKIGDRNSVEE